jgi:hypothetical protein
MAMQDRGLVSILRQFDKLAVVERFREKSERGDLQSPNSYDPTQRGERRGRLPQYTQFPRQLQSS